MFGKQIKAAVEAMQEMVLKAVKDVMDLKLKESYEKTHKVCAACRVTGHAVDMVEYQDREDLDISGPFAYPKKKYFHNGCFSEKFNQQLCPCGCGKWIDIKKKK
jgi:hypothetical protein